VGTNTAIILPAQGICFAIPVNTVKFVAGQLIEHGKIHRGFLGLAAQDENGRGLRVLGLEENGPAERAGLERGDLVISFSGKKIEGMDDLYLLLDEKSIGKPAEIVVLRDGDKHILSIIPWVAK
jgi:S1-C subfamily serine protease